MEKRWMTIALLSASNTMILDEEMSLSYLFDRKEDHFSSQFTMKWCKWSESCNFEEETPNKEQRIVFTNPIKAWSFQHSKCNVTNHLKKTEPRQLVITPDPFTLHSRESNN